MDLPPDLLPPEDGRPHRRKGPSPVLLLVILAGLFVAISLSASVHDFFEQQFGIQRLLCGALGLIFLYVAWLAREQGRLRERLLDLMEEVLKVFYGPNFRRERQAVDILISALDSDSEDVKENAQKHLRRITGQDFGASSTHWADWWAENRSSFKAADVKRGENGPG